LSIPHRHDGALRGLAAAHRLGAVLGTATALIAGSCRRGQAALFSALFCLLEWLRGHVLTGFRGITGASWKAGSAASRFTAVAGVMV
jgi:apolipoprotein N-acyltransferase